MIYLHQQFSFFISRKITHTFFFNSLPTSLLTLRVASTFRNTGGIVIRIEQFYQHPEYNGTILDYDITVLKLASPLNFGTTVAPIRLPESNYPIVPGANCFVTGWGALVENGSAAFQLQVVEVPLVSQQDCIAIYGVENITDTMVCAGYTQGGKDACQVS